MSYDRFTSRAHRRLQLRLTIALLSLLGAAAGVAIALSLNFELPSSVVSNSFLQNLVQQKLLLQFSVEKSQKQLPEFQKQSQLGVLEQRDKNGALIPWTFYTDKTKEERVALINQILDRVKSKDDVLPLGNNTGVSLLRSSPLGNDTIWYSRKVVVLLPGESVEMNVPEEHRQQAKAFFAKCLGATPDRKDAPGKFKVTYEGHEPINLEISPQGNTERLEPKLDEGNAEFSKANFGKAGQGKFSLSWPADAPGLLVFEGFDRAPQEKSSNSPGVLFVTVDSLPNLDALVLTKAALNRKYKPKNMAQWNNLFSLSDDSFFNMVALFAEKSPADAGLLLPEGCLTQRKPLDSQLEAQFARANFGTHRIQLGNSVRCEKKRCLAPGNAEYAAGISHFETLVEFARPGNMGAAQTQLFANPLHLANSFVHMNISREPREFALTWKSAKNSEASLLRWVWSGLQGRIGWKGDVQLHVEEKTHQVDLVLSQVVENLSTNALPHFVLLMSRRTSGGDSEEQTNPPLTAELERGAALVASEQLQVEAPVQASSNTLQSTLQPTLQSTLKSQLSMAATLVTLAGLDRAKDTDTANRSLVVRASNASNDLVLNPVESPLVASQSNRTQILMFPYGWTLSPTKPEGHLRARMIPLAKERTTIDRRRKLLAASELHLVHFLFPEKKNAQQKETGTRAFELTTNQPVQGCFSNHPQANIVGSKGAVNAAVQMIAGDAMALANQPWHVACVLADKVSESTFLSLKVFENSLPVDRAFLAIGGLSVPPSQTQKQMTGEYRFDQEDLLSSLTADEPPFFEAFAHAKAFFWKDSYAHFDVRDATWIPLFVPEATVDLKTIEVPQGNPQGISNGASKGALNTQ